MGRTRQLAAIWMATGLAVIMCGTAAAASRTEINSVSLWVESDIEAGDSSSDVDVTSDSSRYTVDDVEVTNEPKNEWDENDKPKLKVTLEAEDDYYFPSGFSKSDVDLSGADGKVTSLTRKSSTLIVNITLDALDEGSSDRNLDVYGLEWDESDGMAMWEDSGDARKYEVRLYRILDLSLRRSFWQRIVGLGTIHVDSSDKTMKAFDIHNIRNCEAVKEQLSQLVEQERDNKRVSSREFMGGYEGDGNDESEFDEPDGHY